MNVNKILILFFFLVILIRVPSYGQFSVGIEGGLTTSNLTSTNGQWKTAGKFGIMGDYKFKNNLVVLSGLEFVVKGANSMWSDVNYNSKMKEIEVDLYYLEVPVSLGYKIKLKDNIYLIPNLGLYFAYGFWGNGEAKAFSFETEPVYRYIANDWNPFKEKTFNDWSKTHLEAFDRFDTGLRIGANAEVYKFLLKVSYECGLKDIWSGYENIGKDAVKNKTFSIGLGYKF